MSSKMYALEFVDLVKAYRNGQEHREGMPRWLAEIAIACIPNEEPEVARARIEVIHVNQHAPYPVKAVSSAQMHHIALRMATLMTARLVA